MYLDVLTSCKAHEVMEMENFILTSLIFKEKKPMFFMKIMIKGGSQTFVLVYIQEIHAVGWYRFMHYLGVLFVGQKIDPGKMLLSGIIGFLCY